jgi:hypothetical protein
MFRSLKILGPELDGFPPRLLTLFCGGSGNALLPDPPRCQVGRPAALRP